MILFYKKSFTIKTIRQISLQVLKTDNILTNNIIIKILLQRITPKEELYKKSRK